MSGPDQLEFGPFRLDPAHMRLWRGAKPIPLQRQPLAVLHYLVTNAGRVVPSEELLRHAWSGTHVSRTTLKVCVRTIRVALGDDAAEPCYVETVGREGYRFLIVGHASQLGADAEAGGERPVVGRDAVIAQLERFAARAKQGQRQCVFVSGEPGIGKTTVVDLFLQRVAATRLVSVGRGQCLEQYGEGEAYLPMLEALVQLCRAPGGRAVLDVLRAHAPTWLVQMPALVPDADVEALQRRVVGVTRERMLREMAEALDALTAERTLVLVFEDLHWGDRSTIELLAYVAQRRERAQLLVVGTYRPVELVVREHALLDIKHELQSHRHAVDLALELLVEEDVAEYVTKRLGKRKVPEALARQLHWRTDGNPLFMVNLLDDYLERGLASARGATADGREEGEDGAVPDSVQQTISRQIARRTPAARSVLEAGSIAGMEFTGAVVAACLDLAPEAVESECEQLVREAHFLRDAGVAEWRDGTVSGRFAFRHALYQQVLYQRIPAARQARLHRRIAEREELGYGDRSGEIAARLASHFSRGRDPARAARYVSQAGENALRRSAYHEATRHFSQGIELLRTLPESTGHAAREFVLQARLASALMVTEGAEAAAVLAPSARAIELSRRVPDDPELIAALDGLRGVYLTRGDLRSARELAERTLTIAQRGSDPLQLGAALFGTGAIALFCGDFPVARDRLEKIVAFAAAATATASADVATMQAPLVVAQSLFAGALWFLGFPDEAARRSRDALAAAKQLAHPLTLANVQLFTTIVHLGRDEVDEVRRHAEASRATCHEHGLTTLAPTATILEGWALARQKQAKRGLAQIRKGFAEYEASSGALFRPWLLAVLAQALVEAGQDEEAFGAIDEALATSARTGERTCEAELHRMKGELLLAPRNAAVGKRRRRTPTSDATTDAEACFVQAIETARRQGARSWELRAVTSLSRLRRTQGRASEARAALAEVYDRFSEGFDTPDLKGAKALLAELA